MSGKRRLDLAERIGGATGAVVAIFLLTLLGGVVLMVLGNVYYWVKLN